MIKNSIHRIRSIIVLLSFFMLPQLGLAITYQPGETLDPDCTPTDTSCFVQAPITGTATSSTFQTPVIFSDIITIVSTSTPASVENVLYNSGSTLFWNGVPVGLGTTTISSLNGISTSTQFFAVGTSGSDFNIVSTSTTHTFNIPDAGITSRGFISTTTQTFAGEKTFTSTTTLATTTVAHLIASNTVRFATLGGGFLFADASGNLSTTTSSVTITNALSWLGNTLTSTVNGVATTTQISYASSTTDGIISTTTQTFAGDKTFSGTLTFATSTASGLTLSQNGLTLASSTPATTSSSLYNIGNTLYWDGAEVLTLGLSCACTTGWMTGGAITINSGDATKIDIASGTARIVDISNPFAPVITELAWEDQTALDPSLVGRSTWIGVQDDGSGNAQFVFDTIFDSLERRSTAILGRIWSTTGSGPTITNVALYRRPAWGILTAFQDFVLEFGSWNISGNAFSANGANLLLDKASGTSYRYHADNTHGRENVHIDTAQTGITSYNYHIQGSAVTYTRSQLEPNVYNSSSLATSTLPNLKFSRQEIYYFPVSGTVHVLYGQTEYNSIALAEAAGPEGVDPVNLDILDGSIHRATIIMKGNTTVLTDESKVKIINHASGIGGAQTFGGFWSSNESGIFYNESGMNVGIGTSTPATKLHVQISTDGSPVRFQDSDGYCEINPTSTTWTCTSDAQLKTNVLTINDALDGILALNPVNFDWKSQVGEGEEGVRGSRYGLIAQEVEEIFPYLVATDAETGLKSVAYGGLTIPMLKALQEIALLSSTTAATSTTAEDGSERRTFLGKFLDRMIVWFADAANGIGRFFAESVDTKELCLTDHEGKTCYTRGQLNTALSNQSTSQVQSVIIHTPSSSDDAAPPETATTTSTTTPPTDDTTPDTEDIATTTSDTIPPPEEIDSSTEDVDATTSNNPPPEEDSSSDTEDADTTD